VRVVILGCGYVGLALGRQLTPTHDVIGVRRSDAGIEAIEDAGFRGVQADVTMPGALRAVPDADAVVFAASSGGRGADAAREVYVEGQRTAMEAFAARESPPDRYVYTSSTGVYGDHGGAWVDEGTPIEPTTPKTEALAEAESIALSGAIDGTVVRFAGLYGPGRYRLARYLEGPVTEGYLNMIHRDDAAGVVAHLLETGRGRGDVVLAVDDEPVSRWAFADWLTDACGVAEPPKQTTAERLDADDLPDVARRRVRTSKRCDNSRLHELGYEFTYPTFREGYREAVAAYREQEGSGTGS